MAAPAKPNDLFLQYCFIQNGCTQKNSLCLYKSPNGGLKRKKIAVEVVDVLMQLKNKKIFVYMACALNTDSHLSYALTMCGVVSLIPV